MKRIIGITGGIASGKSNVSKILSELGYKTLSADTIAKELSFIGMPIYELVKNEFGKEYILPNGNIDRTKVAELIFSNDEARQKLNKLSHPLIKEALINRIKKIEDSVIFIEIPLLYESKFDDLCNSVICVYLPNDIQKERLAIRDNLTKEEAQRRIDCQMPLEQKAQLAEYIVDSRGSIDETRMQVNRILERILEDEQSN